jgi:ABC-2 type transport system ATP-binding protein
LRATSPVIGLRQRQGPAAFMQPIITISGVSKTYASGFQALKSIDLEIRRGEIFALLGPNGAGKTTLINIVCGIVKPSSGEVKVAGHDIIMDYRAARSMIGLAPQELTTNAFEKVWDDVSFSRGLFGKPRNPALVEKLLKDLSLWEKKGAKIITLSGGMKRRHMIAKALSHEPEILFLDEPTAGVDVELRRQLWDYVRQLHAKGVTIVLTTHYLEEAEELCDRIAIIHHGRVIANEPTRELVAKAQEKAVVVTFDKDIGEVPVNPCFEDISLIDERTLEIIFRKDKVNAGQVLASLTAAGLAIVDVSTRDPDLEDVFLSLVSAEQEAA